MDVIFLDTETTGVHAGQDRLCSVAYKTGATARHGFFKPPQPISIDAMAVHHITNDMVADKPAFIESETYEELSGLLKNNILVAHNAPFDVAILEAEGISVSAYICTLRVARHLDTEGKIPRFGLQYLRYLLDINIPGAVAHDAAGDVLILEALFNRLQDKIGVEEMVEISQEPALLHRINFGKHRGRLIKDIAATDRGYLQWLLSEKERAAGTKVGPDDADWIHTLKHYLS